MLLSVSLCGRAFSIVPAFRIPAFPHSRIPAQRACFRHTGTHPAVFSIAQIPYGCKPDAADQCAVPARLRPVGAMGQRSTGERHIRFSAMSRPSARHRLCSALTSAFRISPHISVSFILQYTHCRFQGRAKKNLPAGPVSTRNRPGFFSHLHLGDSCGDAFGDAPVLRNALRLHSRTPRHILCRGGHTGNRPIILLFSQPVSFRRLASQPSRKRPVSLRPVSFRRRASRP